jgi:type VI secretion system protein ImpG
MIDPYFLREMRYLREGGKAFAAAHPEEGRYLNVDAVEDRDPYVERLFEGFALLSGRVHARLDDELPEVAQRMVELLYPHFLKPFPSCCTVQMKPRLGLSAAALLPRGTEVRSAPVGPERTVCRFQTAEDVWVNPLDLADARTEYEGSEASRLRLRFEIRRGADYAGLRLDRFRLHLHADAAVQQALHLHLTRHLRRVEVRLDGRGDLALVLQRDAVRPAGLRREAALLPPEPAAFSGIRLLQEYLLYRRRFWAVEIDGLDALQQAGPFERFEVDFVFDRAYPEAERPRAEQIRLHTTPAVNLFDHDAEPVQTAHEREEIVVRPSLQRPGSLFAYDVREVVGIDQQTGARRRYTPLFGSGPPPYRLDGHDDAPRASAGGTYSVLRRTGLGDQPTVHLALDNADLRTGKPREEAISIGLRCHNGSVPHEHLREGGLREFGPDVSPVAEPSNLDVPSLVQAPPLGETLWALLAHWSFAHGSVATPGALRGLLDLYDWAGTQADRRRRAGIQAVSWRPKEILHRGGVRRGTEVLVDVADGHFSSDGDLALFGLVLGQFLAAYATVNAFVHLQITTRPSGREMTWTPERGSRPPL